MEMNNSDKLIRGLLFGGAVAFTVISGKTLVETARAKHGLSRVCTAALGRTLLQAAMMSCQLKNEDDALTCIVSGGGPAGNIVCSARNGYKVKGYIENAELELPPNRAGKLDVASAVGGKGCLTVVRRLANKEPYSGKCELVSGKIAEDFVSYYVQSEQTPCLIYLGVRVAAASGEVLSAGGLMVTPLPGCGDAIIDALQDKAESFTWLSLMLENETLPECVSLLFGGMGAEVLETAEPLFECDCGRERLAAVLITLGADELNDMIEKDGGAEMKCRFCGSAYAFSAADLETLASEAQNGGIDGEG